MATPCWPGWRQPGFWLTALRTEAPIFSLDPCMPFLRAIEMYVGNIALHKRSMFKVQQQQACLLKRATAKDCSCSILKFDSAAFPTAAHSPASVLQSLLLRYRADKGLEVFGPLLEDWSCPWLSPLWRPNSGLPTSSFLARHPAHRAL